MVLCYGFVVSNASSLLKTLFYLRLDRNNGVGLCSMVARAGGIVSPYVVLLVIFFQYSLFYNILLCLNLIAIALIFSYFKPFQADLPNLG